MRKLGAIAFGIPVIVAVYLATLLRRSVAGRVAAALAVASLAGIVVLTVIPPAPSAAVPASVARVPVAADFTSEVRTGLGLLDPIGIKFSAPMDPASVAAAVRIRPAAAVSLVWSEDGTQLRLAPVDHWAADTLYTVVIDSSAAGVDGATLPVPVRAAFLTADGGSGMASATLMVDSRAALITEFRISLDREVDPAVARRALRTAPKIAGTLAAEPAADGGQRLTFTPATPLTPDTTYRIWFEGLVDADGLPFTDAPALTVRTGEAPAVVRFRPLAGTVDVARDAAVSVRFTQPMDRGTTAAAFTLTVNGTAVAGKATWAEQDTVLVFDPATDFPYGAAVVATLAPSALSKAAAPLAAASASLMVVPKPEAPAAVKIPTGGGGAVSGSWTAVEAYYLKLMNCTRQGGLVTSTGTCSSPGGRDVAALKLDAGISSKVSRPYAKLLATRALCSHFIGGNPGDRLRLAGYTSYRWAENLGCRSGNAYSAVLGSHLYFQSERNWSPVGGHYKNLMNAAYDRAGIAVWVYGGRVRLVVDFYHP